MRIPVVFLTVLLLGCASGRGGLGEDAILDQAPLVSEAPGVAPETFPRGLTEEEAATLLSSAKDAYLRGDFDSCLRIVRESLDAGPPEAIARELRSLRFDASRQVVARTVLRARARPVRDVLEMGQPAEIELLLRNVAPVTVRVSRAIPGSSDSVFVVEITREDWDIFGNVRSETKRELVKLSESLEIPPGGSRSIEFTWPTPEPKTRHLGFTVLRFSGVLRAAAIEAGEQEAHSGIPLEPGEIRVFPAGYEPLTDDPVASIGKAFGLGAREHLLVAAGLVGPERRTEAVSKLVSLLPGSPSPTKSTAMAALRFLTGKSFANRAEAWQRWWMEENPR